MKNKKRIEKDERIPEEPERQPKKLCGKLGEAAAAAAEEVSMTRRQQLRALPAISKTDSSREKRMRQRGACGLGGFTSWKHLFSPLHSTLQSRWLLEFLCVIIPSGERKKKDGPRFATGIYRISVSRTISLPIKENKKGNQAAVCVTYSELESWNSYPISNRVSNVAQSSGRNHAERK